MTGELDSTLAAILFEHHRKFLSFLERHIGSRTEAEDILQTAYIRSIEKGPTLRQREKVVPWFRRLLANAAVDHHRRRLVERQALQRLSGEEPAAPTEEFDSELEESVCQCVLRLTESLPENYRDVLTNVELRDVELRRWAAERDTTLNAARVRLHRARKTVRRQLELICGPWAKHGCPDCACRIDRAFSSESATD